MAVEDAQELCHKLFLTIYRWKAQRYRGDSTWIPAESLWRRKLNYGWSQNCSVCSLGRVGSTALLCFQSQNQEAQPFSTTVLSSAGSWQPLWDTREHGLKQGLKKAAGRPLSWPKVPAEF